MKSVLKRLPQPVPIPVPSTVDRKPELRQKIVKQELPIAPEISEFLTVGMGLEPLILGLGQSHGLGCFAGNADVIKMDGMVKLVLRRSNNHSVSRDFFIHGDVNAQKKADDQKTDHNDGNNFTRLRSSHSSVLKQGPRLDAKNFIMFELKSQIQLFLSSSVLGRGSLKYSIFSSLSIFSSSQVADPLMFFFSLTP